MVGGIAYLKKSNNRKFLKNYLKSVEINYTLLWVKPIEPNYTLRAKKRSSIFQC